MACGRWWVEAARDALAHTPEQLPVLKKAGVVDAGGQGLVHFDGMLSVFRDGKLIAADEPAEKKAKVSSHAAGRGVFTDDLMKVEDIKNGYCTQFLVNKNEGPLRQSCGHFGIEWRFGGGD